MYQPLKRHQYLLEHSYISGSVHSDKLIDNANFLRERESLLIILNVWVKIKIVTRIIISLLVTDDGGKVCW